MSHVNTYKARIKNAALFMEVCEAFGARDMLLGQHTFTQYGSNRVDCIASCLLPGWKYKIGITAQGEVKYDNFGSDRIASMETLGKAIQDYHEREINAAVDWTLINDVQTVTLPNGDKQITMLYGT